jgi:hypothetical protein
LLFQYCEIHEETADARHKWASRIVEVPCGVIEGRGDTPGESAPGESTPGESTPVTIACGKRYLVGSDAWCRYVYRKPPGFATTAFTE